MIQGHLPIPEIPCQVPGHTKGVPTNTRKPERYQRFGSGSDPLTTLISDRVLLARAG
jgi:hypothetical protein